MRKLLTTHGVRLLLAFLCIVAGSFNMKVGAWSVAGSSSVLGYNWDNSGTNPMTSSGSYYHWSKAVSGSISNFEFKLIKTANSWTGAIPSTNYQYSNNVSGNYTLNILTDGSNIQIGTYCVVGDTPVFPGGWSEASDGNQEMQFSNGVFTWTSSEFTYSGSFEFKVRKDHSWDNSWPSSNKQVTGGTNGNRYTLTVTFNPFTSALNYTLNLVATADPDYYFHHWSNAITSGTSTKMTKGSGNSYSITLDLNKNEYLLITDYASHSWSTNRFGPTAQTALQNVTTANATANGTAGQNTDVVFKTYAAGNYTFTFNSSTKAWTAKLNSVILDPLYLRHWTSDITTGSAATMTTTDNVNYTVSNVSLARGEYIVFSTVNSGAWNSGTQYNYNGSADKTFASGTTETASTSGTKCYVTPIAGTWNFTFNTSNGQWTPTLVSAAAQTWYLKGDLTDWTSNAAGDSQMSTTDNITYTKTITINERTTSTKNLCLIDGLGDWNDVNANHRYYSTTTVNPTPSGHTVDIVKGGNNNNIVLAKGACGTYTFSYNVSTGKLTVTGPAVVDIQDWYLLSEFDGNTWKLNNSSDKFTYDENSGNYVLTKSISTTADTHFLLSKKVASAESGWSEISGYRYCAANGTDQAITFGTAYPVGQYNDGSYYIPSGKVGTCTFTLNASGTSLTVTFEEINKNTGHMYIIGRANGGVFQANLGTEMTKIAEGVFQADNVELMSGADFSFTAKLGNDAEDWTTANAYRFFAVSTSCFEVTEAMVGSVAANTTGSLLSLQNTGDGRTGANNFMMDVSGAYRITIDINNMKVHFEKMYYDLYMFGKGFTHSGTTISDWDATQAIQMTTTDGNIYHLDAVTFADVEAAGFFFSKVKGASNDNSGKQDVIKSGFVPDTQSGNYLVRRSTEQNDMNKPLKMVAGPTDNSAALSAFNNNRWFIHRGEMAGNNKYNVIVNLAQKTVTIKENVAVQEEMKIRLEQTDNLIGKRPAVRVWITGNDGVITKFEGEWADNANGTHMPGTPDTNPGNVTSEGKTFWLDGHTWFKCSEYTSYDNRKWWEWEVGGSEFRIASITFYRNGDDTDNPDDPNGYLSRRSGVLYFTWDEYNTVSEIKDYTTDYYVDHVDEAPECATMLDDHLYVYFVNTPGWDNVYCYAWDTNNQGVKFDPETSLPVNAAWPGDVCTIVGYNDDGFAVYRYDFGLKSIWENAGRTLSGVIFNAGFDASTHVVEEQTGDFVFKNGAIYDYVGRVSLERSLGVIIAKGVVKGPKYEVEDDLIVVYYNPGESGTIQVPYIDEEGNQQIAITNYTGAYYAKDINNANDKSLNYNGKLDYVFDVTQFNAPKPYINEEGQTIAAGSKVQLLMQGRNRYDQSNWVRLVKANDYATANHGGNTTDWENGGLVGKRIKGEKLAGQIVDNLNPTMIVEDLPADAIQNTTPYVLNDYIAPHFNDNYSVNDNGDLFFVRPKANEVAHITWAVYKGNNEFYTPDSWAGLNNANTADGSTTGDMFNHGNAYNLKGGFKVVSWAFAGYDAAPEVLTPNQAYQFDAIIRYKDNTSNGAPIITPQGHRLKEGARVDYDDSFDVNNSQFEVYPVNVNPSTWIVTGIDEIETDAIAKEVVAVKYYNIMGVEQRELQPGVNIVVTIYNDGSRSSAKILK